jgi:hypothetical protein
LSNIAREMPRRESADYKCIQRFVAKASLKSILKRLYQEEAPFPVDDLTYKAAPGYQENRLCWHAERWTNQRVLVIDFGNPPPRMYHAVILTVLLFEEIRLHFVLFGCTIIKI